MAVTSFVCNVIPDYINLGTMKFTYQRQLCLSYWPLPRKLFPKECVQWTQHCCYCIQYYMELHMSACQVL